MIKDSCIAQPMHESLIIMFTNFKGVYVLALDNKHYYHPKHPKLMVLSAIFGSQKPEYAPKITNLQRGFWAANSTPYPLQSLAFHYGLS